MTIVQKIILFLKPNTRLSTIFNIKNFKNHKLKSISTISFLVFFSILFFISSNFVNNRNEAYTNNLQEISKNKEFSYLKNYLLSKINSPYKEINYVIENNDTLEKILIKFNINYGDIKNITGKLKERKLASIFAGKNLNLIIKELDNKSITLVSLVYPVNIH